MDKVHCKRIYFLFFLSHQTSLAASSHCISMDWQMDGAFSLFFPFCVFFNCISFLLVHTYFYFLFFLFAYLFSFLCLFYWVTRMATDGPGLTRTDRDRPRQTHEDSDGPSRTRINIFCSLIEYLM